MTATFQAQVDQNQYLVTGGRTIDAIVTVTAAGGAGGYAATGTTAAQVIMVDCSRSMGYPPTKLLAARKATAAAIDALRDGVPFAVIAGTSRTRMVYPPVPGMIPATAASR